VEKLSNGSNGRVLDTALTVEEVAEKLKVSPATVYSLLRAGELISYRVGRSWRIDEADLLEYIQQKKTRNHNLNT
jgi:putative molybdopterin biosynthesis protein